VPYLLALASSVLWGTGDFVGGTLSRRLPAVAVVGVSQALALVVFTAVAAGTGALAAGMPPAAWVWAGAAGAAGLVGLVAFYQALATGTMGVVAPIAALGVLVPVLVGLVEGERPSAVQGLGALLGVAGGVLASGPEVRSRASLRPVLLALLAGVAFGLVLVFLSLASDGDGDPLLALVGMRAVSVSTLLVVAVAVRSLGGVRPADLPALALVGMLDGGANLAYAVATTMGLLALVAVLASLYPAVTVVLARIVHHERMSRTQDAGIVAAILGVVLVAAG
jgi:drug/metabolite transporter (DMT)-like permease